MELSKRKGTNDEGVSNAAEPATSSTNKFLSSMGGRVFKANEVFATTHGEDTLLGVWTAIFLTWIVVHSLVYVVVQYGFFKGTQQYLGEGTFPNYFVPRNLTPEAACLSGLKNSGFDSLDSSLENVEKWMDESTVVDVPKTGIWIGPVDFSEYLKYLKHPKYFQGYKHSSPLEITPVRFSEDECHILFTGAIIAQTKPNLDNPGGCVDGVRAFALHYTLNPFKINRYYVDFTAGFVEETYKHLDSDDIRDYVCDVMESRCSDTFKYNNFTSSLDCKTAYDNLPLIDEGGYLDGNTKSCRMIHAALASEDSHHCPHISFAPMKDKKGKIKCQESKRQKDSDIFSQYELDTITETGYKLGFPETLYRNCTYNPNMTTDSPFDERPKMLLATGSVPLSYANDGQFQVFVTFIMWITLVLSGVGSEYLVWRMYLQGEWNNALELKWRAAQFIFPLLCLTALGLAITGDFWALPFLVAAMWKLGFPETILLFYSALHDTSTSRSMRAIDSLNAVGTIIHHSSASLAVSALLANVINPNRDVLQSILPLVMQHWFILLRYSHRVAYIIIETTLEIWFEWSLFSSLETVDNVHWIWGVLAVSMVFAHWCYFAAGGIGLILPLLNSEALPEYDGMRRLSLLAVRRASVISASNKYDDGKMDKFEESEIAADDNL